MSVERRTEQMEEIERNELVGEVHGHGLTATGENDSETYIKGLEMVHWTLSRPSSTISAENENLGDRLIPRYNRSM